MIGADGITATDTTFLRKSGLGYSEIAVETPQGLLT